MMCIRAGHTRGPTELYKAGAYSLALRVETARRVPERAGGQHQHSCRASVYESASLALRTLVPVLAFTPWARIVHSRPMPRNEVYNLFESVGEGGGSAVHAMNCGKIMLFVNCVSVVGGPSPVAIGEVVAVQTLTPVDPGALEKS